MSENLESNGPNNSESSVNQEEGAATRINHADSKDELFVDASDELAYEARNADNRESVASNETETETSVNEEKPDIMRENHFVENDIGAKDNHILVDELERVRNLLDKTVNEKDSIEKEYKEERETLSRQLVYLSHQLKVLTDKELLLGEKDGVPLDVLGEKKSAENVGNTHGGDAQLSEVMNECSLLLSNAKAEQLQSERLISQLNATLQTKDHEIEVLNTKIAELSVSHDVATSYLNSVAGVASESQLEKDQYVEVVADRMLAYLAMVVNPEELLDNSIIGKISHVERNTYQLIEKYNHMLYEIYQLGQCLSKAEPHLRVQEEFGRVFALARDELLELKGRDVELVEKIRNLEEESKRLVEQVEKEKEKVEAMNGELSSMKTDIEHEKMRCSNAKEKLSLAVTKGKALVQQRDSLKQSLAEKMTELENCQAELQEKSNALQAAESSRKELVKSEHLIASLQETISQRSSTLEKFKEILSQIDVPEELQSMDLTEKVKWLVNDRNELKVVSSDFFNLKDAISSIDLPETTSFTDLGSRLSWLKKSFYQAKDEASFLLDELNRTKEVARNEIDCLSASLSTELQEKDYFQRELDDLACQYKETVEKVDKLSSEKDQIMRMLFEESGIVVEDEVNETSADPAMLIRRCFEKTKEQTNATLDTSVVDYEIFDRMQTLLFVRNQEFMMCEQLLEEDMQTRFQLNDMSNELRVASEELCSLKEEKDSLRKDLERSEEKFAILREKLSMAVKKGKGLVQERENLKSQLDEKDSKIEKLTLKLQNQESTISDCRDQINRLSTDLERIPVLEADVLAMKDQLAELEQLLSERNNLLQRVIESVDHIILPVDIVFGEPVEKLKWIAGYINECQDVMRKLEHDLGEVKEEASSLASEVTGTRTTMKSLEDELSAAEDKIAQLAEEKREIGVQKENVDKELEKAVEEAQIQTGKFSEACASRKSLEDELSVTENNISTLKSEKEEAQASRDAAVMELEKVREEVALQTNKLTDSYKTIKSLEDALSQAENNLTLLTEQNSAVQVGRTTLENEMQKLKNEAESKTVQLENSEATLKSLEDALLKAEKDISVLEDEKRFAEQEILTLNSKLKACMEELAGTSSSLQSRSVELIGPLNDLQMLLKDQQLLSTLKQCFQRKFEDLQNMNLIVKDIYDQVVDNGSVLLHQPDIEGNSHVTGTFTGDIDNIEIENIELNVGDADDISSCFMKTAEGFRMRNKMVADKLEDLSSSIDEFIAALLGKLQKTRDEIIKMSRSMESLNQKAAYLEAEKQEHEESIKILENDVTTLLSACSDAYRELQFEVNNDLLHLDSVPELEKLSNGFTEEERELVGNISTELQKRFSNNRYAEAAEKLLFSASKAKKLSKLFESTSIIAASTIQDLQKQLQDTTKFSDNASEERDILRKKVSNLENDMNVLQDSCRELKLKLEDYQAKEEKLGEELKEKEAEISSLHSNFSIKERETEDSILSTSQVRTLIHKVNGIDVPSLESEVKDLEPESSADVKRLFYVVDSAIEFQEKVNILAHEKEQVLSTLSTKTAEIEYLKGEIDTHLKRKSEFEKIKMEAYEFTSGLEKIISLLGGNEFNVAQMDASIGGLLLLLEKQVTALLSEAENSKFKTEELGCKLIASQKFVDELSTKVRLLEDSYQTRAAQPEIVQERSIFEAPSLPTESEISEIEDVDLVAKRSISPVPSAAHVRTLRKGSTDHLAINIDSESARLINREETDEDKGHLFKSLNTTGLIPTQGKMIADRIDGLWVSGGRLLMNRPGARLGLIAYWIFMHMWLLGTIL